MKKIFLIAILLLCCGCSANLPMPKQPTVEHVSKEARFSLRTTPDWNKMTTITQTNVNNQPFYCLAIYPENKPKDQGIWIYSVDEKNSQTAIQQLAALLNKKPSETVLQEIKKAEQQAFLQKGWQESGSSLHKAPAADFIVMTNKKGKATVLYAITYYDNVKYTVFLNIPPGSPKPDEEKARENFFLTLDTFRPL